ncbi:MAG: alkaline phosphatase family protein [archaeon]
MTSRGRSHLYIGIAFAALGLLSAVSFPVRWAIKYISFSFATAMSFSKVYLFLIFGAAIFLILWLPIPTKRIRPHLKTIRFTFFAGIAGLALLSLLSHAYFISAVGAGMNDDLTLVRDGHLSGQKISHIHTLKPMMMLISDTFSRGWEERLDAGHPFVPFVPKPLILLALIIFILLIPIALLLPVSISHRWPKAYKTSLALIYTVAAYATLKALVDGGPLVPESVVSIPVLAYLCFGKLKEKTIGKMMAKLLGSTLAGYSVLYYLFLNATRDLSFHMTAMIMVHGIIVLALFGLIFFVTHGIIRKNPAIIVITIALFALIMVGTYYANHMFFESEYLLRNVPKGSVARYISTNPDMPDKKVYKTKYDAIYERQITADTPMWRLIQDLRLNPSFYPVDVIPPGGSQGVLAQLTVGIIPLSTSTSGVDLQTQDRLVRVHGWRECDTLETCDYEIVFDMWMPTPSPNKVLFDYINKIGIDTYLITGYDVGFYEEGLPGLGWHLPEVPLPKAGIDRPDGIKEVRTDGEPDSKKVVILILESARAAYRKDYAKEFSFLTTFAADHCGGSLVPVPPTFSAANSLALLSGAYPEDNGLLHIIFLDEDGQFKLAYEDSYNPSYSKELGIVTINQIIEGKDRNIYTTIYHSDELSEYVTAALAERFSLFWILDTESEPFSDLADNPELANRIRTLDKNLKQFISAIQEKAPDTLFIIMGDHGIAEIKELVRWEDIRPDLEDAGIDIDASQVWIDAGVGLRIWTETPPTSAVVEATKDWLSNEPCFYLVDKAMREDLHIDMERLQTGDIMIGAKPGCMLVADELPQEYDNVREDIVENERNLLKKRPGMNSMHGYYNANHPDLHSMLVIGGPTRGDGLACDDEVIQMVDIAPTILDYFGIDFAENPQFSGTSLYEKYRDE